MMKIVLKRQIEKQLVKNKLLQFYVFLWNKLCIGFYLLKLEAWSGNIARPSLQYKYCANQSIGCYVVVAQ